MIPQKDIYVDADDKITDDPSKYAAQVAVAGVFLEERVAERYGIDDTLVSVDEPGAVRTVRSKPLKEKSESEPLKIEPAEEEEESESEAEKSGASVKVVKKGAKNK